MVAPGNISPTASNSELANTKKAEPAVTPTDFEAVATTPQTAPPNTLAISAVTPAISGNNAANTGNSAIMPLNSVASAGTLDSSSIGEAVATTSTVIVSLPLSLSPSASIDTLLQNSTNGIKTVWTIITTTVIPTISDQPVHGGQSTIFPSSSDTDAVPGPSGNNAPLDGGQSTNALPDIGASDGVSSGGGSILSTEQSVTGGEGTYPSSSAINGVNANTNDGIGTTASVVAGNSGDSTIVPPAPSASSGTAIHITPLSVSTPSTFPSLALTTPSSFSNGTLTTGESPSPNVITNSSLSADITSGRPPTMSELTLVENGETITLTAVAAKSGSIQSTSGSTVIVESSSSSMAGSPPSSSLVMNISGRIASNTFALRGRGFFG
ncbi:hypothetical protein MMC26_006252 [Xylographa opegraphella]|nr:hypothetical protein [Xylographa opegraphella]